MKLHSRIFNIVRKAWKNFYRIFYTLKLDSLSMIMMKNEYQRDFHIMNLEKSNMDI